MKTLVIGLGNPLLSDDSVGLHVIRQLRPLVADRPDVEVDEDYRGGLQLMERLVGYDRHRLAAVQSYFEAPVSHTCTRFGQQADGGFDPVFRYIERGEHSLSGSFADTAAVLMLVIYPPSITASGWPVVTSLSTIRPIIVGKPY